eukprot:7436427-Pyramimonas_sp.AAC.1
MTRPAPRPRRRGRAPGRRRVASGWLRRLRRPRRVQPRPRRRLSSCLRQRWQPRQLRCHRHQRRFSRHQGRSSARASSTFTSGRRGTSICSRSSGAQAPPGSSSRTGSS